MPGEYQKGFVASKISLWQTLGLTFFTIIAFVAVLFLLAVFNRGQEGTYAIYIKGAELTILSAGLASLSLLRRQVEGQREQLRKQQVQMEHDHQWRTYRSYHELFPSIPEQEHLDKMYDLAKELSFDHHFNDMGREIPKEAIEKILGSCDLLRIVRTYLDGFEVFCGAVSAGIVDDQYAYLLQGGRVIRNYTVFEPLIKRFQLANPTAYQQLEKLAGPWGVRRGRDLATLREQTNRGTGTTPRIALPR